MDTSKKIYQLNSYLPQLEAHVESCKKINDLYEVILDKTIFYPHMSGGQPRDTGTINGVEIIDVFERKDEIIHVLKEPLSNKVTLSIDFNVRFDHMQQHTGQHILSYAFDNLFKGKTVGFHLSEIYTTIDLDIQSTEEMAKQSETLANEVIYKNKNINFHILNYDEALKMNLRKAPPELDTLRIMEIEDTEFSACGGTHVSRTGEVGIIKIVRTEKYKSGTRVEFLCGLRALNDYSLKNKELFELSSVLSCRTDMIIENINKLKAENKAIKKDLTNIQRELNELKAKELINSSHKKNEINFIFSKIDNIKVKDLRYICSKTTENENFVSILVSENESNCSLVFGQSNNLSYNLKSIFDECKTLINANGGGTNNLLQGTGNILKGDDCIQIAKDHLLQPQVK